MNRVAHWQDFQLFCPACRTLLAKQHESLGCPGCHRQYPVLFGIPDLRLGPDRYLSLEDERAKATKLQLFGQSSTFEELLNYYYSITDDVAPVLATKFAAAIHASPARAVKLLTRLDQPSEESVLVDLGCGAGGTLMEAAKCFPKCVGVDIGLRWLVIAQKRFAEARMPVALVCADVETIPFADGSFSHVVAENLLDHVHAPLTTTARASALVAPGGQLWITGSNRWWIGPHSAVGVWAAGLQPAGLRRVRARLRGRVDTLRNASFVSAPMIRRIVARTLSIDAVEPRTPPELATDAPSLLRFAVNIYLAFSALALTRALVVAAGPAFQILAHRPLEQKENMT